MRLSDLDTRIATRQGGRTAGGGDRPWGFGNLAPGPCLPHGSAQLGPNTDTGRSCGYDPTRPIRGFAQIHVCGTGGPGKYGNRLENGRDLVLRNPTAGTGRDYLHGARWNGVELTSGMIPHTTLAQGGVLEFTTGKVPRAWGDLA